MNRKDKKIRGLASAALTLALMLSALTSCGFITIKKDIHGNPVTDETSAVTEETERPVQTEAHENSDTLITIDVPQSSAAIKPVESKDNFEIAGKYLAALTAHDLDGVPVYIASTDAPTFAPSDVKNLVYNARIERNSMVEKKYNTKIIATQTSIQSIYDQSYAAVKSGDFYTDLIGIPLLSLGSFVSSGLLANLNSLPFTDYTAPYFNYSAMKQTAAGNNLYGAIGELNTNTDYLYCVYFNKDIVKTLGVDSPYDLVYENDWTWENFRKMTKLVSSIDGVYGHGSSVSADNYIDVLYASAGETYFSCDIGKLPMQKALKNSVVSVLDNIRGIMYGDGTVYDGGKLNGKYSGDGALNAFYHGNMLFCIDRISYTSWLADMKDDWGIVPLPKVSDSQIKYSTYADLTMPAVAVLKGSPTVENAGIYLQAANAASYGFINDVYYDVLTTNIIRDSDTLNMLDYITCRNGKGNIFVDFGQMFGSGYPYIADGTYAGMRNSVKNGSSYSSYVKSTANGIAKKIASDFAMIY